MNGSIDLIASDLSNRQAVYCLFFLRRLTGSAQADKSARDTELDEALNAALSHAGQTFPDPVQREAAIEDAEIAAAVIGELIARPDFNMAVAIEQLEALRQSDKRSAETVSPPAQEAAAARPVLQQPPEKLEPTAQVSAPVATSSKLQQSSTARVAILAAAAGALAGALAAYALQGPSVPSIQAAVGEWRWDSGAKVTLGRDGRFLFNDQPAGYFFAATNNDFILIHGNGRFIDYLSLNKEGNRLTGRSATGVVINGLRQR